MTRPSDMTSSEVFAARPHGTRVRYVAGKCRCAPCTTANRVYALEREHAKRAGDWNGFISAEPMRLHLLALAAAGVGRRTVADISGVSATVLHEVKAGRQTTIRARTLRSVLRVTAEAMTEARLVPSEAVWCRLDELLDLGFTKREIARHLGYASEALQFKRGTVTARNAARVERVYAKLKAMLVRRLEVRAELGALGRRDDEVETVMTDRLARRRANEREWRDARKGTP